MTFDAYLQAFLFVRVFWACRVTKQLQPSACSSQLLD
jgi:hypothetical protein